MHPQVIKKSKGACPICGMALEPVTPTPQAGPNPELADMTQRFWIGLAFALPVLILEMGPHLFGSDLVAPRWNPWIQLALASPVVLWAGWPFFQRGWQSVINRSLNMFSLIALGAGAAWMYSVVATLAPGFFPATFYTEHGTVAVYFEPAWADYRHANIFPTDLATTRHSWFQQTIDIHVDLLLRPPPQRLKPEAVH